MNITDAYDYTDKLTDKLLLEKQISQVTKEFNEIKDNADRVKFLEKLLIDHQLIPNKEKFKKPKNNETSRRYREEGNKFYKNRQYVEAFDSYNKSVSFAEENDENVGFAYANRSAIYCELKYYKRSLKNIQMAIENNYPKKNIEKLLKRKELCENSIKNDIEENSDSPIGGEFLKLTHEPNPKIPFISNCLELRSDEKFGRFVVTNKNLSAGDIVAIEEPFCKTLLKKCTHRYCCNCLGHNFLDLVPCHGCTAVMFCSEECRTIGMKKFHKYECNIIDSLQATYTKIMQISSHTFFEALYAYESSVEKLMTAMNENENSSVTVYDFNFDSENKIDIKKQRFMAIDSLITNQNHRTYADLFQRSGIVAIMTHLFFNHTDLSNLLKSESQKDFYRRFIMKQTQIAALNYHGVFDGIMSQPELNDNVQYASGSYPFCSLINHSCAPNVVRVSYECNNYIMINRPIKAGEQLFDNYGYHHCLESLLQRQTSLKSQYMFGCTCAGCRKDFPLFPDLSDATKDFDKFIDIDISKLTCLDLMTAKSRFKEYCKKINVVDKFYPCREVSALQECILRCLFIFKMTKFNLELLKYNN